jgi:hypothetical protein
MVGGYNLVEVLCLLGYHGTLKVVVYDPWVEEGCPCLNPPALQLFACA